MNSKKYQYYGNLLTKYREYMIFYRSEKNTDVDIRKLQDEVKTLADNDPEFKFLLFNVIAEYQMQGGNKFTILEMLRKFSEGKSVKFDETSLIIFGDLYQHAPDFRSWCDADEALRQALTYWLNEYHRRVANGGEFAKRVLLRKLHWLYLGKLGLETPVEFDKTERALVVQWYHTDAKFWEICDHHNVIVRETIASWLEEHQQQAPEEENP